MTKKKTYIITEIHQRDGFSNCTEAIGAKVHRVVGSTNKWTDRKIAERNPSARIGQDEGLQGFTNGMVEFIDGAEPTFDKGERIFFFAIKIAEHVEN